MAVKAMHSAIRGRNNLFMNIYFFKVFLVREMARIGDYNAKVRFICLNTGIGVVFFVFLR